MDPVFLSFTFGGTNQDATISGDDSLTKTPCNRVDRQNHELAGPDETALSAPTVNGVASLAITTEIEGFAGPVKFEQPPTIRCLPTDLDLEHKLQDPVVFPQTRTHESFYNLLGPQYKPFRGEEDFVFKILQQSTPIEVLAPTSSSHSSPHRGGSSSDDKRKRVEEEGPGSLPPPPPAKKTVCENKCKQLGEVLMHYPVELHCDSLKLPKLYRESRFFHSSERARNFELRFNALKDRLWPKSDMTRSLNSQSIIVSAEEMIATLRHWHATLDLDNKSSTTIAMHIYRRRARTLESDAAWYRVRGTHMTLLLAVSLWVAVKLVDNIRKIPRASVMAKTAGVSAGALIANEVPLLDALRWNLMQY